MGGFIVMYIAEKQVFPRLAKGIAVVKKKGLGRVKKRKEYKVILEDLRI
jgi:cation-transporting ATPase 13A3/4/5